MPKLSQLINSRTRFWIESCISSTPGTCFLYQLSDFSPIFRREEKQTSFGLSKVSDCQTGMAASQCGKEGRRNSGCCMYKVEMVDCEIQTG